MPFEQLQALRSKMGIKAYGKLKAQMAAKASGKEELASRRNHNSPAVQSSKQRVSVTRNVVDPLRPVRLSPLC